VQQHTCALIFDHQLVRFILFCGNIFKQGAVAVGPPCAKNNEFPPLYWRLLHKNTWCRAYSSVSCWPVDHGPTRYASFKPRCRRQRSHDPVVECSRHVGVNEALRPRSTTPVSVSWNASFRRRRRLTRNRDAARGLELLPDRLRTSNCRAMHCKNIRISNFYIYIIYFYIWWRVFHILTKPVPYSVRVCP